MTAQSSFMPWLSVVMPVHCGEQWIEETLQSLITSIEGIEILVIDSSPNLATRDIVQKFTAHLSIRYFYRPDLLMWHAKTNFAVTIASANHICWLHQDDVWLSNRAGTVREWITSLPAAALHLAPSILIDKNSRRLGGWRCPLPKDVPIESKLIIERLLVQNFVAAPAPIFRKDAWLACGGLDESLWYTADWDVWLKLAAMGDVYYHSCITTGFRIHKGSLTMKGRNNIVDFKQQMQKVFDYHLAKHPNTPRSVKQIGQISIDINTILAEAAAAKWPRLLKLPFLIVRLGPMGLFRYLRYSRIFERLLPRLKANLLSK